MFEIVWLRSNIFKNGDRRTRARKHKMVSPISLDFDDE
jgi:hypothetical protein